MKDMDFKFAGQQVREILGEKPEKVNFITINRSVAKSGLSAVISLFLKTKNDMIHLATGRVHGCGLDRGHEAAYNAYSIAYGYGDKWPYQKHMTHSWL